MRDPACWSSALYLPQIDTGILRSVMVAVGVLLSVVYFVR